jgi:hypothetical protein
MPAGSREMKEAQMTGNTFDLPAKVFVIGTPHHDRNVTLHNGVWDSNFLFTFIWTTKSALDSWMTAHPSDAHYYEMDIFGIIGCLLFKRAITTPVTNNFT